MKNADDTQLSPLEEVRAKRAALAKAREEKAAAAAETLALVKEQRALAEETALAEAQDKHGEDAVELVPSANGAIIVHKPSQVLFRNFQESGKITSVLSDKVVRACLCYPTLPEYESIIKERPGALKEAIDAVCRLAGVEYGKRVEK